MKRGDAASAHKKGRRGTALSFCFDHRGLQSGLHDLPAGRAIFDQALASGGFLCAILGSGHATASAFLGHDEYGVLDCFLT